MTASNPLPPAKRDRRIPGWAAPLLHQLVRDRPAVLTRQDLEAALAEAGIQRGVEPTVRELQRLGWLIPVHLKGVWAFLPPGEEQIIDPYIDLRAWRARDPEAVFALAGEAAALHLGYLDRTFTGPVAVWIPSDARPPHGLRPHISVVALGWSADIASHLAPTTRLLHNRHLDLTGWAGGLPAFGPEALVVQLAARPASFRVWSDLVAHLAQLASDCDVARLAELLQQQSVSAWQRAAYLLHCGGRPNDAIALLEMRVDSTRGLPKVQFGEGPRSLWVPQFHVVDHLIFPLQQSMGKA